MPYLSGIFLLWGGVQKKKKNEKHWKMKRKRSEECKENQITTINLGFTFYLKIIFCSKPLCEKSSLPSHFIYSFYTLQDIWNAVMIHQNIKYINIQIMI